MSDSGIFSNAYAYVPLNEDETWTRQILSAVGSAIGQATGKGWADPVGGFVGDQLGYWIQNSEAISQNVQVFLAELNDWRSWGVTVGKLGGGSPALGGSTFP